MSASNDEFEDANAEQVFDQQSTNSASASISSSSSSNKRKKKNANDSASSLVETDSTNVAIEYKDADVNDQTVERDDSKETEVEKDNNQDTDIIECNDSVDVIVSVPIDKELSNEDDNALKSSALDLNNQEPSYTNVEEAVFRNEQSNHIGISPINNEVDSNKSDQPPNNDQEPTESAKTTSLDHPPLPDRKSIKDCLRLDQPEATILHAPNSYTIEKLDSISSTYDKSSSNYLLQSKYNQLNKEFELKDIKIKESINTGTENIKKTFNDIKNAVGGFNEMFDYKIDWEFWSRIVNNYELVVKNESNELNQLIMKGIPKEFRGIIWQLVSKSKNFQLEEFYYQLKNEPSIHEKSIKRDLSRTSFFTNVEQVNKGEDLYNVIKAYSLFDPDVGYTQGMIFITIPLIMNMNESECFCLLVNLMKDYKLRDLFCPEMKGLHLLLYEFDRLLEIYSPVLYNHMVKQGIKSSMYASQWFLTFFAYKFPLDIVLRIYDIIITQGIESILKFAINLLTKNESSLLLLRFDKLLEFLKDKLFNIYINDEFINYHDDNQSLKRTSSVSRRFSLLAGPKRNSLNSNVPGSKNNYYKLDELVEDSMRINVEPVDLNKFELEFENIYINEKSKSKEIENLKVQNGKLRHDVKELEKTYASLNRDHIDIVQKMVDIKITLPEIENDNNDLERSMSELRLAIEELKSKIAESPKSSSINSNSIDSAKSPALPTNIESDIQELLIINAQETEKFANLEDELNSLLLEDERLDNELKNHKNKKWFGRWSK